MADLFGKSALTPEWVERFQDLSKLNAYAANQPVHLANVTLTGWDISGAKLPDARFEDTEWKDVKLERGVLSNVTFKKSKLQGVEFDHGVLTDVTFEDTELRSTSFYKAKLQRVRFIRCKLNGVNVDETVESTIEITDSKLVSSSLSEGQLVATVKNSTLKDIEFTDLESPSSLAFEKSELNEANFGRSILEQLTFIDSKIVESGGSGAVIDRFTVTRTALDFGLAESRFKNIVISGSTLKALGLGNNQIQELEISDCTQFDDLGLYETKLGSLKINRCTVKGLRPRSATIDLWSVKDSQIANSKFEGMKVKTATLENVTLDKELNFTNARIDQLVAKNITKLPGLNLITTGSNVKFE